MILPPGISTPEMTPTPGILLHAILPPPPPDNPAQLVILPVSDLPTPTPTGVSLTPPSSTPGPTTPPPTLAISPTATFTTTFAPVSPTITAARVTPSPTVPTLEPVTASPAPTATLTPAPTATPAVPDRILINAIGLDAPVVPVGQHALRLGGQLYSQWDVPNERAAGWQQSSAPLGQTGNTVLDGHHNVYGEVFHHLVLLQAGRHRDAGVA